MDGLQLNEEVGPHNTGREWVDSNCLWCWVCIVVCVVEWYLFLASGLL